MDTKDARAIGQSPQEERSASGDGSTEPTQKKPYKSPTISRHGNLRLMTQLE